MLIARFCVQLSCNMTQLQQFWHGRHDGTGQYLSTCEILYVSTISSQHGWDARPKTVRPYCKPYMPEGDRSLPDGYRSKRRHSGQRAG